MEALTDRERETLRLLLAGHTAKSIAAELDLSVHTINDYLRSARQKLGVTSSREAARLLAEQENAAPQNVRDNHIGMAEPASRGQDDGSNNETAPAVSKAAWIIGGAIMLASVVAVAVVVSSGQSQDADVAVQEDRMEQAFAQVEKDARDWVRLIDENAWAESWKHASDMFQDAVTQDTWTAQVKAVRAPLGETITRVLDNVEAYEKLPGAPEGQYQIAMFNTAFANKPGSTETVVLVEQDGAWKVAGYFIR